MSKRKKARTRPRIGDIVEIITDDGSAMAQYCFKNEEFGHLVRVLHPDTSGDATADAAAIACRKTQFITFFGLGGACHRGIARIVGMADLPAELSEFPVFRQALRLDPASKAPCNWLLWDGTREWTVPSLTNEQSRFPIRCIMNDTLLVELALSGWTGEAEQ